MGLNIMVLQSLLSFFRGLFAVLWAEMVSRTAGPLPFRVLLHPLMVSALAFRDGVQSVRQGAGLNCMPHPAATSAGRPRRGEQLWEGLTAASWVFVFAVLVDLTYQYVVLTAFRPLQTLIVGTLLAFVPYLVVRGSAFRVSR